MSTLTDILLDESDATPTNGQWLVLGGEADLANGIDAEHVAWWPLDERERTSAEPHVVVCNETSLPIDCARVVLPAPPDRDLARHLLLRAQRCLVPDGRLLIAGANAEGGKSVISDAAALLGPPLGQAYRQKHRIARFGRRPPAAQPDWASQPGIAPGTWSAFSVPLAGTSLMLASRAGVFSPARLDAGTALLLRALPDLAGCSVLDVGCGAGVIGIAAIRAGAAAVTMTDPNLLAVATVQHNLRQLGLNGRVIASDVYHALGSERYDVILSNPPFHRGKMIDLSVAERLVDGAPCHLAPGGRLLLVANAFLAYGKAIERQFGAVEVVTATPSYHVLMGADPRPAGH